MMVVVVGRAISIPEGGGVWLHDDILSGMTHIPSKV